MCGGVTKRERKGEQKIEKDRNRKEKREYEGKGKLEKDNFRKQGRDGK